MTNTSTTGVIIQSSTPAVPPRASSVAFTFAGDELRELRQRMGLSQTGLAHRLHVARATVCMWENGRRAIPASHIGKILATLSAARREQEVWRQTIAELRSSGDRLHASA